MKMLIESLRSAVGREWKNMHSVCALPSCRHTMLIRSVPQRRVGIQVGQLWYCSVDCFREAARLRLAELSDERVVEMPHRPRLSIGLVMVSRVLPLFPDALSVPWANAVRRSSGS